MKESAIACILLIVIIGLGIFVRVSSSIEPMWLDECHTAWTVDSDSLAGVVGKAADGNQPPLYFMLVWAVAQVFGLNESSLRLISLVSGSALMIVASLWARSLTNRWSAAVLVAALIAFDGQFIFYATEARSYALVQLIGLVQAIFFWRILSNESEQFQYKLETRTSESFITQWLPLLTTFAIWTLLSIAILYCHYTSVWLLVAEAVVVLVLSIADRKFPIRFFCAGIAIIAAMVPACWNIATVFDRRENWSTVSSNGQLWTDIEPWLVNWILIPIGFAFAAWMIGFMRPSETDSSGQQRTERVLWLWIVLWAIIGPVGIASAELFGVAPMALVRYSIVCWVAIAIFASLPLKLSSPRVSWIVAGVILGSSFFSNWWTQELVSLKRLPVFRDEDWVSTAAVLAESGSSEPIFQLADVIEDIDAISITDERFRDYLLFPIGGAKAVHGSEASQPTIALPTWNIQFTSEHLNLIRKAKGCWLIFRGDIDYAMIIPGELEQHLGTPIEFKIIPNEQMTHSRVHLIRVRLNESTPDA